MNTPESRAAAPAELKLTYGLQLMCRQIQYLILILLGDLAVVGVKRTARSSVTAFSPLIRCKRHNLMEWKDIITAVIAVYGAALTTYTIYTKRRENKARVEVESQISLLVFGRNVSDAVIMLTAKNPGEKAILLNTQGFLLPNDKQLFFPLPHSDVTFPYELQPGKDCRVWSDAKKFAQTLKHEGYYGSINLVPYFKDQLGRVYKGKKWKFNLDVWA